MNQHTVGQAGEAALRSEPATGGVRARRRVRPWRRVRPVSDRHPDAPAPEPPRHRRLRVRSHYVPMRDGVRLAVDVWRPGEAEGPLPAIVHITRYFRSVELRPLLRSLHPAPFDHTGLYRARRRAFVTRSYAWVDVDARGSGASFGSRIGPWSPEEVADGREIVDWIAAQDWSNGRVGALGISYDGTAAERQRRTRGRGSRGSGARGPRPRA